MARLYRFIDRYKKIYTQLSDLQKASAAAPIRTVIKGKVLLLIIIIRK